MNYKFILLFYSWLVQLYIVHVLCFTFHYPFRQVCVLYHYLPTIDARDDVTVHATAHLFQHKNYRKNYTSQLTQFKKIIMIASNLIED